jgi:hypothetical protein
MSKKLLPLLLAAWMTVTCGEPFATAQVQGDTNTSPNSSQQANPKPSPQERHAGKIKAEVQRRGVGELVRVNVELYDKTKLGGYIGSIGEDQFVLREASGGKDTNVDYASVKKLRAINPGNDPGSNSDTRPGILRTIAFGASAFQSTKSLIVLAVLFAGLIALVSSDKS